MDSLWSVSDGSPCLSRLDFRAFHLQPPYCHFARLGLPRYRFSSPCEPPHRPPIAMSVDLSVVKGRSVRSEVHDNASAFPDRLGRIEFTNTVTDYSFTSGCCSTLSHDSAVTTFGYRPVTITWTGLSPIYPNAFTGALATLAKAWENRQPASIQGHTQLAILPRSCDRSYLRISS